MQVHRHPPAVVDNLYGIIRADGDGDIFTKSCQGFVYAVVHDFVHTVVQSPRTGGSDIHARPFTDRFQPLQYLDLFGVVHFICHGHFLGIL